MNLTLKNLVIITCIALMGIIGLQSFWLIQSYRKTKLQLMAAASTALVEHQIQTGVSGLLSSAIKLASSPDSVSKTSQHPKLKVELDVDSLNLNTLLEAIYGDKRKEYSLEQYHEALTADFATRNIKIPFELALVSSDDKVIASTTDTATFNKLSNKTKGEYSLPVRLNRNQNGVMVVAFRNMPYYLLKDMWVVLAIALILTIVCIFSFYQLVSRFFKEKKLALMRNDFMNNMTHELKTPVSTASLAIQLLQDQSVAMAQQTRTEYLALAKSELSRLAILIDKVLKIAAFERTDVGLNITQFATDNWINTLLVQLTPLTNLPNITISTSIPDNLFIKADQEHLSGVMYNLIENAVKYRDATKHETAINISLQQGEEAIKIEVRDNGSGIPEEYQRKIFDKFFRVPKGDLHEVKGYGLGLSYVQEVVKLHGGTIDIESKTGGGTLFTILLPK